MDKNPKYKGDEALSGLLNRKYTKRITMTVNYNAGKDKCLQVFKEELLDNNVFVEGNIGSYDSFISAFHKFLDDDLFKEVYIGDKHSFLRDHSGLLVLEDARINLNYFTRLEDKEVIKIKDDRWVYSVRTIEPEISKWKTRIALNANIIQAYDAELARHLVNVCDVWPVHDSFAVSIFELDALMDETCAYFSKKLNRDCYSIFIFL